MNYQNSTVEINELLNSCVKVKSLKIDRQTVIPQQICFCLNAKTIGKIKQLIANQTKFTLSPANIAILRCYALFNLPLNRKPRQSWQRYLSQTSLVFSTQYTELAREPTTLIRSTLNLEGKISQQIKHELVQNAPLLERVTEAHYWLTAEIINQLPLEPKVWRLKLVSSYLAIALLTVCILLWYFLPQDFIVKLTICLGLAGASFIEIAMFEQLRRWTIERIVKSIFAQQKIGYKLGLKIVNFLL